jgi:type II restriction enzyme
MNLNFNVDLALSYKSNAQIARVLTENWVKENSYCPNCGKDNINEYPNNQPVADFFCGFCNEDFELKSKTGNLGKKITDGAYRAMIARITSEDNPNFFFLTYLKNDLKVNNFLIIPKHFFQPDIIEERPPLSAGARRAGWIGCNIDLQRIPELGRIFLVKDSIVAEKINVLETWNKTIFLRQKSIEAKGWTLDVLKCLDGINAKEFSLDEVYKFEKQLKAKHPENNFVKDKIRQQLQVLRDMNVIEFVSRGKYKKTK